MAMRFEIELEDDIISWIMNRKFAPDLKTSVEYFIDHEIKYWKRVQVKESIKEEFQPPTE